MRPIHLICPAAEYAEFTSLLENRLTDLGLDVRQERFRTEWLFDLPYLRNLKRLISEKAKSGFVVFFGGSLELFPRQADLLLCFSAYHRWFDQNRMRVIPHAWTPIKPPENLQGSGLIWDRKPALRVGFMGRTFRSVTATNYALRSPQAIKNWIISGALNRTPEVAAFLQQSFGNPAKA